MTYDRPRFSHKPVHGERHPDAGPSRHNRRLIGAVDRANEVASAIRTRRLAADLGLAVSDRHGTPDGPWRGPYGARNGGRRSARFLPGPSTNPRLLDVVWISGIYPDYMTTKSDRTWSEL